jgi:transcription antitermination protein NusB
MAENAAPVRKTETRAAPKNARRRSREFALQGLYQWQLSAAEVPAIREHLATVKGFDRADGEYFSALLGGVIRHAPGLEEILQPHLDRKFRELSPIERAILLIAAFELSNLPEVPYRVVINEAVELAKSYGGTDGHKYVNGVLDKLAVLARPNEARTR